MINKRQLRIWHRYAGAFTAFFLLFLTSTGILLNHTGTLKLQDIIIKNASLLHWYGIKPPVIQSMALESQWLSSDGEKLYLNTQAIDHCPQLIAGVMVQQMLVIACNDKLILSTPSGEIIEALDSSAGLPTPVTAFFSNDNTLWLETDKAAYRLNIDELSFSETPSAPSSTPVKYTAAPDAISNAIIQQSPAYGINLERLLLDIHSGRIAGTMGVWLVDATAIVLLFLAASGLTLWLKKSR